MSCHFFSCKDPNGVIGSRLVHFRMRHEPADDDRHQRRMPRQIPYIIANEGCERFSFYGMRNILTPFLISTLLLFLPESERTGEAKHVFHTFVIGVYFFPLLGGWLADRFFGKYNTVFWLSLVYCAGHACLPFSRQGQGLLPRPGPDRARLGRHQAAGRLVRGRPVRPDQQGQGEARLRRLLLDHQLRLLLRFAADAALPEELRPCGGLRHPRRPDVHRHHGAVERPPQVRARAARRGLPHSFTRVAKSALLAHAPGAGRPGLAVALHRRGLAPSCRWR
jgi:POT family proton-dependent oligopeptide transporter